MPKYKIVSDYDANDQHKLESKTLEDAAIEALNMLGWNLAVEEEDNEDESCCECKIKCPKCGISVPDAPEDTTFEEMLCNSCYEEMKKKDDQDG